MRNSILIIEDNEYVRENTAELLALHHYHVLTAENGKTGFDLAKQQHPDVILCDMVMPKTDGYGFLNLAKKDADVSSIPVVFFSAGTLPVGRQQQLIGSANGFLKKPFLQEELLAKLEAALRNKKSPEPG